MARASRETVAPQSEVEELTQGDNVFEANGTLSEFAITVKECKKDCNIDGEDKKITSAMIYGSITEVIKDSAYKFALSALDFSKHQKNGNEGKGFKGIMTVLGFDYSFDKDKGRVVYTQRGDGLSPKINGTVTFNYLDGTHETYNYKGSPTNPDRLNIRGHLGIKESLTKDQSDLRFFNELDAQWISKSSDEDKCSFVIDGYVKDIVDEMNSNGGTTGAGIVTLVVPDFFGVKVYDNFRVLSQWDVENDDGTIDTLTYADFKDFCKVHGSFKFNGDIDATKVGSSAPVIKNHFGASSNVRSGYVRFDWNIKGATPLDKPYKDELIDKALAEYQNVLDTDYDRQLKSYQEAMAKKNNSGGSESKRGLGRSNTVNQSNESEEENPFD